MVAPTNNIFLYDKWTAKINNLAPLLGELAQSDWGGSIFK